MSLEMHHFGHSALTELPPRGTTNGSGNGKHNFYFPRVHCVRRGKCAKAGIQRAQVTQITKDKKLTVRESY